MRKTAFKVSFCFAILLAGVSLSCRKDPYWTEDTCLREIIEHELETNPKLKQRKIPCCLISVKNGYAELRLSDNAFPESTLSAIRRGANLKDISSFDKSVDVLIEAEEIIKRVSKVKAISWTADEPGHATSTGSSLYTWDDVKSNCSEYQK